MQIHTPTVVQGRVGVDGAPPPPIELLGASDVTNNGRHLGFYRELDIKLKCFVRNHTDIFTRVKSGFFLVQLL